MKRKTKIRALFIDIGGVLLTDGWSHEGAIELARKFGLDAEALNHRHSQALETYELGKLNMDQFLDLVVFDVKRPFTGAQFARSLYDQSEAFPQMITMVKELKEKFGLKIVVVSNEGRGLNEFRIKKFKLTSFVDSFISSCYVCLRKPDIDIFRLALETNQVSKDQVVYIDNTQMFVQIAEIMGIRSVLHVDYHSTRVQLASYGLKK